MEDSQREEWSRHFDVMCWAVNAIFAAGAVSMLSASFSNETLIWPDVVGIALVVVGVYYVAGYRIFRKRLHSGLTETTRVALKKMADLDANRLPHMWDVFVICFLGAGVTFIWRIGTKLGMLSCVLLAGTPILILMVGHLWRQARSE